MTDDLTGLLRAVIENPDDDHVRLVYADALDELPTQRVKCHVCGGTGSHALDSYVLASRYGRNTAGKILDSSVCGVCNGTGEGMDTFPQERAELIRVQVELSTHPTVTLSGHDAGRVWANGGNSWWTRGTHTRRNKFNIPDSYLGVDLVVTDGVCDTGLCSPSDIERAVKEALNRHKEMTARETFLLEQLQRRGLLTGREAYIRGFIRTWTGTADEWLKVEDKLFWHGDQAVRTEVRCTNCDGDGLYGPYDYRKECLHCTKGVVGVVTNSRPLPPSAHPLRKVVLTSVPPEYRVRGGLDRWLVSAEARWPGLEMFVGPEYTGTAAVLDDDDPMEADYW